ncbi:hypothetical protein SK128_016370 [Halocaridina rubra]|uniref:Chitin-binding type-2 domain-containing protein n=1 Tax=Halocaridina rubra TaxID=373956 RepID=A0AAN8ZYA0_HALRR
MRIIVFLAFIGAALSQRPPSASYGAPNRGRSNGNGFGNGGPSNGYAAPPSSAYGAPGGGYGEDPAITALTESIPGGGVPGEDYPILASVPDTGFNCDDQAVAGYYADTDPEAGCQVFHICQDRALRRQKDSFLCPNGTIFNQQYLVCDWWFNFDCETAEDFYSVNELIGEDPNAGYGNGNGNTQGSAGGNGNGNDGYGSSNNGNGNGSNGYGAIGNGRRNGNGKRNGSRRKSSGRRNGGRSGGANGYGSNGNGNGAPSPPSGSYGAPF